VHRSGGRLGDWFSFGYRVAAFDERRRAQRAERDQEATPMNQPWPLASWPRVPTRYLLCQNDRVFDAARTRTLVRERLGIEADDIESGHCGNLARPTQLAECIHGYIHALRG
jgi:Alpha/beta hydrolase family